MKEKIQFCRITLPVIIFSPFLYALNTKKLKTKGTFIFEESELFDLLNLKKSGKRKMSLAEVTTSTENFYKA